MRTGELGPAISALYDAALDPQHWKMALKTIAGLIDSPNGMVYLLDKQAGALSFAEFLNFPITASKGYQEHWHALDPHAERAMSTPMGVWVFNHQWFDKHYVARSEYFNDFMIPNGHMQVAGCRLMVEDRFEVHMAFQRPPGQLAYDLPQRQILESLGGHLQRAAAISMRLADAQRVASFVRPALNSLGIAVMVLDAECRLEYANRPAEVLLRTSSTLTCQSGRLSARSLEAQSKLEALVRNAANGAGAAALFTDATGQSLQAVATPLAAHAHACTAWQRPLALLMLADGRLASATPAAANPARFSQMFGLTPAEARLACGLLEGQTMVEYAHAIGINIETARTHLRAVLIKTGTRRQAEMMRLLGKLPDIGAI